MRRAAVLVTLVTLALWGRRARADEIETSDVLADEMEIFAEQVSHKLDMISIGDSGGGLFQPGLDYEADVKVDLHRRRAHVRIGGGDDRLLAVRLDARILFDRGLPRVKGKIDLGVAGKRVSITLPDVTLQPRSYEGETYIQINVPLIEGRF